jgi:hypothetical protein
MDTRFVSAQQAWLTSGVRGRQGHIRYCPAQGQGIDGNSEGELTAVLGVSSRRRPFSDIGSRIPRRRGQRGWSSRKPCRLILDIQLPTTNITAANAIANIALANCETSFIHLLSRA